MNIEEVLKTYGSLEISELHQLLSNVKLPIDDIFILPLKFKKIMNSQTVAEFLFSNHENMEVYFKEEDLNLILNDKIQSNIFKS